MSMDARLSPSVFCICRGAIIAVQEMLVAEKAMCNQYTKVDLKMLIFTTTEGGSMVGTD